MAATTETDLQQAWNIANRMTLLVLDALTDAALTARLDKGRTVGEILAHMHNNRLAWLEHSASDLFNKLTKIEGEQVNNRAALRSAFEASGAAVAELLNRGEQKGKITGFKRSPTAFMGYLIAHEGYHHGEIGILLAQAGHRVPREIAYGMWEWGKI